MFGLMRPRSCAGKQEHRLYYCGTCKSLGSQYGQGSRMLLNHDTVFLAELLGQLGAAPAEWTRAYRSFNCMTLPKDVPPVFEYAAAATVVLTQWKIIDHLEDTGRRRWRIARRLFNSSARRAAATLKKSGFPLHNVEESLAAQQSLEQQATTLAEVARPTALATAAFFEHGARLAAREELSAAMRELGYAFGELVYLLDAFEDFDKDARTGAFNPLARFQLSPDWAVAELESMRVKIAAQIAALPLEPAFASLAAARLQSNLSAKLNPGMPLFSKHHACHVNKETWRERWAKAVAFAREMRDKENPGWLKGAAVVAGVSFVAFAVPQWAKGVHNSRECLSLGFNLMAIGSVLANVTGPVVPEPVQAAVGGKKKGSSCCGDCDCQCCCCDSCCCDSCGCDSCSGCGECGSCCDCGSCCSGCGDCGSCCDC